MTCKPHPRERSALDIHLSSRELATILAALRHWQRDLARNKDHGPISPDHFDEEITPLSVEEIDGLCERMNSDPTKVIT